MTDGTDRVVGGDRVGERSGDRDLSRVAALTGVLLMLAVSVWSVWDAWPAMAGAPLGWRLRTVLPDQRLLLSSAFGFALAGYGPTRWRKVVWALVAVLWAVVIVFVAFGPRPRFLG